MRKYVHPPPLKQRGAEIAAAIAAAERNYPMNSTSKLRSYKHTYEPRDVLRCGALSLLQKPLNYMGIQQGSCPVFL
jgi:hypothetical protein